ncbi:hypothetical protein [Microvirga sp. M2]|uniref:hypothetical protein n=1 Tax=Microvirga sp. M2 TaxID=3073270 RepID=UPI0039C02C62
MRSASPDLAALSKPLKAAPSDLERWSRSSRHRLSAPGPRRHASHPRRQAGTSTASAAPRSLPVNRRRPNGRTGDACVGIAETVTARPAARSSRGAALRRSHHGCVTAGNAYEPGRSNT